MATTRQRSDHDTFKPLFRDHWEPFQQPQPRYQDRHVQAVIDTMLGCGTLEAGYTTSLCPHGLEEKRVAFSGQSSFCLSCCKVDVEEWVAHIGRTLYEGVSYRHVVWTRPAALRLDVYRHRPLLAALRQCGVAMRSDALAWCTTVKLEAGSGVGLETAGRAGHGHPPLHILMTSGGRTPPKRWREVDDFPFTGRHKKWQYHLCTMLKQRGGTRAIKAKIDALWRKSPRGLVAYVEEGKVPAGGEGLADDWAKYVGSPPISLRRILRDDGQRGRYWYNDHKTKSRQEEEVSALTFIGRMGQPMLPKGFHRLRYDGLQATGKAKKVKGGLTALMVALGRLIKGTYRLTARQRYRERVLASTGRDPLRCGRCGRDMILWQVWPPRYGVV
jgi:Transposase zinc-binding domain/Putative transposase